MSDANVEVILLAKHMDSLWLVQYGFLENRFYVKRKYAYQCFSSNISYVTWFNEILVRELVILYASLSL